MRLKRQEEMADVVQKLGSMQQENARLRELQLGMVQLLQRMKREAVQWQVRNVCLQDTPVPTSMSACFAHKQLSCAQCHGPNLNGC